MFLEIVAQRLREDLLSLKTPVVLVATALLLAASATLMVVDLGHRQETYAHDVSQQPDLAPLLRPPVVLSALARGVEADVYGGKSVAGIHVERVPAPSYENPLRALFPTPDLRFIVQYVLSLFALMMAFDLVAGLKERRTLSLIFSNPVPRWRFLAGQCLGGYLGLAAAFVVAYLLAVVILVAFAGSPVGAATLARLAGIALVSLLYLAVFFMLGATVSTLSASSGRAFVAALLSWVVLVLVVPHTLILLAGHWRPIPSVETVSADKNAVRNDILGSGKAFATEWPRANAATEAIDDDYARKVQAQQLFMMDLTRLSPAGSYVLGVSGLAGTSAADSRDYVDRVRSFISRLRRFVYVTSREDPEAQQPSFFRRSIDGREAFLRAATDAGALLVWLVGLAAVGFWRFERYDVR